MTDDGERHAKSEVRLDHLEDRADRHEAILDKFRSDRMKLIIATLFVLLSTLLAIFKDVLF